MDGSLWILTGATVGLLLGMTGGGGSLLAVPLLVYVHSLAPPQAVGVSLATVAATALWGAVRRWRQGLLDLRVGLMFSVAGMIGAPIGSWMAGLLPPSVLLTAFAVLMVIVAARMAWAAKPTSIADVEARAFQPPPAACRFDPAGKLTITSRCTAVLAVVGLAVGILSGLFGVGGGFVIVPALVLLTGMKIHRAVATSLMVVALIGLSGFISHQIGGNLPSTLLLLLFIGGGIAGLEIGSWGARKLPAFRLQQVFAAVIVVVASFMLWKTLA